MLAATGTDASAVALPRGAIASFRPRIDGAPTVWSQPSFGFAPWDVATRSDGAAMLLACKARQRAASAGKGFALAVLPAVAAVLFDLGIGPSAAWAADYQAPVDPNVREVSTPAEAQLRGVIIATFPLTAPSSVEEEVARAHGLEVLDRRNLQALGRRLVRFRVLNGRAVTLVLAALRSDRRVTSVQANLVYRLPSEQAADAKQLRTPPTVATGKSDAARQASAPPRSAQRGASAPKSQPRIGVPGAGVGSEFVDTRGAGRGQPLVDGSRTALRWPTADEPFVNVGPTR